MKNLTTIKLLFFALILGVAACKKLDNANPEVQNLAATAKDFTAIFGPQMQKIEINPAIENKITLKGGTKITIPANSFSWGSTNPGGVKIVIETMEVLKRSDVVFSGTNTNHISGAPLASDGFIYLNASLNGVNADKALLKPITITIPTTRTGFTQIWEGVEKVDSVPQMAWQAPRPANGIGQNKEIIAKDSGFTFDMGNLGWINCDVFYSYANPKTTTTVQLINNPGSLASFRGFTGETFVFFCAKGSSVAAQLYTPDGANKVKSYTNAMPIGVQGKYLSFSIKDGNYYYAELETTIIANQNITLTLLPSTEAQIQTAINSLNTY
jgi:hypothetical protein